MSLHPPHYVNSFTTVIHTHIGIQRYTGEEKSQCYPMLLLKTPFQKYRKRQWGCCRDFWNNMTHAYSFQNVSPPPQSPTCPFWAVNKDKIIFTFKNGKFYGIKCGMVVMVELSVYFVLFTCYSYQVLFVGRDALEVLGWASAQIHCLCSTNGKVPLPSKTPFLPEEKLVLNSGGHNILFQILLKKLVSRKCLGRCLARSTVLSVNFKSTIKALATFLLS